MGSVGWIQLRGGREGGREGGRKRTYLCSNGGCGGHALEEGEEAGRDGGKEAVGILWCVERERRRE